MTIEHVKKAQTILGTPPDGRFGPTDLAALELLVARIPKEAPVATITHVVPVRLSLRALEWSLKECDLWEGKPVSKGRIAEYFTAIERDGKISNWWKDEVLRGEHMSFCAAAFGFAEMQTMGVLDALPPHRAGAHEIMEDGIYKRRPGEKWVDAVNVRLGHVLPPPPGSAAIYDRPGGMHVERVIVASATGFRSVGANEAGGRWIKDETDQPYAKTGLRGFVVPT